MAPRLLSHSGMKRRAVFLIASLAACGSNGNLKPDGNTPDTPLADAAVDSGPTPDAPATFGLTSIFPAAASRTIDTTLTIDGFGINGTPTIRLANCDQPTTTYDLAAGTVTSTSITTLLGADVNRVQGAYTVTVTNGDGMVASLTCALHIVAEPPPTVTLVVPTTAWQGTANDNVNSDATVGIQGTGFISTPNVRWVSTTNPALRFDAVYVGFISSTRLSAVVPSESQMMPPGSYNVFVTNPDNLTAEWMNGATAGVFTITATAPPDITDVSPARIQNGGTCTNTFTITGTGFASAATAWYIVPSGTTCTGSTTDANGQLLCPLTISGTTTATTITVAFPSCPSLGVYPVTVVNPDAQSDYWYELEVTDASSGHLNTGSWTTSTNRLEMARWKHAVQFGFDSFSNAFVYVAGGQDSAGSVLGSVEASQFDLFGTPGPFRHVEQYGSPSSPRVANNLTVRREGSTLVRVGKSLFSIGGTTMRSDSTTPVAASNVVERAEILSYNEMPGLKQPTALGGTGLPVGSWYYRISAIGPWGESLATREVVAINKSGQIQICWVSPAATGATSYNIYRSPASDGRANTSSAVAYEMTGANMCFTDTGTETLAPAPGNARTSLATGGTNPAGTYTYRVSAVVPVTAGGTFETYAGYTTSVTITATDVTNTNQTINVAWDAVPITGVTYRVYRQDSNGNYKLVTGAGALTTSSFADTGIALDPSDVSPRTEIKPLQTGQLSKWASITPRLNVAREGLDGVVIAMDPATSGNLVARILVAGGRDGAGGTYTYRRTAESLGVFKDGTTETSWYDETPVFANARVYYPLLTTQDRNITPFPPGNEPPPCGDCTTVIQRTTSSLEFFLPVMDTLQSLDSQPTVIANTVGSEPIYVIAAEGDDAFQTTNNAGRTDFESCLVDATTGHLATDCGITNATTWVVQSNGEPAGSTNYGLDGVLYFSYLYPFAGVFRETVASPGTSINFLNSAIGRFPLPADLTTVTSGQVIGTFQSASTSFNVTRAYYQMARLLAYVYVVGGYAATHTDPVSGLTVPAGPTDLVERHQQ